MRRRLLSTALLQLLQTCLLQTTTAAPSSLAEPTWEDELDQVTKAMMVAQQEINKADNKQTQKSVACGDIVATIPGEDILKEIGSVYGIGFVPAMLSFFSSPSKFDDVEVRKICASCDSVKTMSGFDGAYDSNEFYDKYCGSGAHGHDVVHSGLVMYPMKSNKLKTGRMPGFVYSRGTVVNTKSIPGDLGLEHPDAAFGLVASGAAGMVSILPDFMGYGESSTYLDRAYLIRDAYLTATLPLWIQARSFLQDESDGRSALANAGIFAGYSEGGYASVALSDGFSKSIKTKVIKTFASAAPFRLSSVQPMSIIKNFDNNKFADIFKFMPIMIGASYSSTYPHVANYNTGQDLLSADFTDPSKPEQNILLTLREEDMDFWTLNSRIPVNWVEMLNPNVVDFFRRALQDNIDHPCESDDLDGNIDKFCEALLQNDLTHMLETADHDIHLCHSPFDDLVDFDNIPDLSRNPNHLSLTYSFGNHIAATGLCAVEIMSFLNWENQFEYACRVGEEMLGRTLFVPSHSACWKIELFDGGILAADYSNPRCSNEEYTVQQVFSTFGFESGNKAYFQEGPIGWDGSLAFKESPSLSEEKVHVKQWDELSRNFDVEITLPVCSSP